MGKFLKILMLQHIKWVKKKGCILKYLYFLAGNPFKGETY